MAPMGDRSIWRAVLAASAVAAGLTVPAVMTAGARSAGPASLAQDTPAAPANGRGAGGARGVAPAPSRGVGPQEPRSNVGPADRPRVDPVAAERGAHLWGVECITCHGAKARGTERGPNLLRSDLVLHDRAGNLLGPFLQKGHPTQSGTSSASFTDTQVKDLMHFLRQRINDTLRGSVEFDVKNILTGDPKAGEAYFNGPGGCTACHSVTGDLAAIGSRFQAPVDLQQRMVFPTPARGGGRGRGARGGGAAGQNRTAITVSLSTPSGPAGSGVLVAMDDFYVTYRDEAGGVHVVKRTPDLTVDVTDPLQAHHDLLDRLTNQDIHDLTAYLETLQ